VMRNIRNGFGGQYWHGLLFEMNDRKRLNNKYFLNCLGVNFEFKKAR